MARGGRFGKYGEQKRRERLRQSRRIGVRPQSFRPQDAGPNRRGTDRVDRWELRALIHSDGPRVRNLARQVWAPSDPCQMILEKSDAWTGVKGFLAVSGEKPCGFVLVGLGPGFATIRAMAVRPGYRGRGIGSRLLNAAERLVGVEKIPELRIAVAEDNKMALDFLGHRRFIFSEGKEIGSGSEPGIRILSKPLKTETGP